MSIGILYFSGTGNSLYIAKRIQAAIGGEIKYIPNYNGTGSEFDKIVLVTPIYSFGMPKYVYELIPKLDRMVPIVVVQNFGGMIGGADYLMYEYCSKNGVNLQSLFLLQMPENFTTTFTVPELYIKRVLNNAEKRIDKIIEDIKNKNYVLPSKKKTKEGMFLKNYSNWYKVAQNFVVNDKCLKCQKCVSICPAKNIILDDGKIKFGTKCIACLGCYHRCSQKAILYKNHKKKDRYVNPNINENDIGKDFSESITLT